MDTLHVAIIGFGNIGSMHAGNIHAGMVKGMELYAICDTDLGRLKLAKSSFGESVMYFCDSVALYEDKAIDVVIIATPHYSHPDLSIRSLKAGYHTLCEKPAGVYTGAVRELNSVAESSGKLFGIMYNQRTNPMYAKLRDLVRSGELGGLKRMSWVVTDWYRSQSYHDSGTWRSTWKGEGGGALINQCPHQLDLWQWIFAISSRIQTSFTFI